MSRARRKGRALKKRLKDGGYGLVTSGKQRTPVCPALFVRVLSQFLVYSRNA